MKICIGPVQEIAGIVSSISGKLHFIGKCTFEDHSVWQSIGRSSNNQANLGVAALEHKI
jgi:hypothetical protein